MLQSSYDEIELDDKYACGDLEVIFGKPPYKVDMPTGKITQVKEDPSKIKGISRTFNTEAFDKLMKKELFSVEYYPPSKVEQYYEIGGIEVIDYIKAKLTPEQYKGYLLGNIYKYSGRLQYKGEETKDIKKLVDYTNWLKEYNVNNTK